MKIGEEYVNGQIIATGDEYSKVKINLGKAIAKYQSLQDCLTIIGNLSFTWPIECVSAENSQKEPDYLVLNLKAFENFLLSFKSERGIKNQLRKRKDKESAKETQSQVKEKHLKKRESIADGTFSMGKDSNTAAAAKIEIKQKESPHSKENEVCSCSSMTGKQSKENSLLQLGKVRDRLLERKQVLSQLDLPSLIMADLIECIDNIHEVLSIREKETKKVEQKIPDEDKTYKDKKKDLIFVEGILPFKSDSYKNAILAGKGNPLTLAYQLVKSCFPESYYLNVTLGKRFYEADEMKEFLKLRESSDAKFPLPFVWGFKNPIEEPFQGEFDLKLGLERVQALIVHILRKCDILELEETLIKNIRGRLVRELNARNAAYRTKQNSTGTKNKEKDQDLFSSEFGDIYAEMSQVDFEQDLTQEDESDKNPISFIWDSDEILTD
uniref:Uncharacterized protein n=1 Tax=Tetranychus urticae TaxID=32264 RepID=T1KZ94_TETUR